MLQKSIIFNYISNSTMAPNVITATKLRQGGALAPKDLTELFVPSMRNNRKSAFKSVMGNPTLDMINMAGGVPHPNTFPILELQASVHTYNSNPSATSNVNYRDSQLNSANLVLKKSIPSQFTESLDQMLQYGDGRGLESLCKFLHRFTQRVHSPQYTGWDVIASCGSTDSIGKAISLFCESGDSILVERWTFPGTLGTLAAANVNPVPVSMDSEGMIPAELDRICQSWKASGNNCPLRAVYLVPTGQNPTGATMSISRRKSIYGLAQKHNLAIIEDDPYYYLQLDLPAVSPSSRELVPSLLSMDTDGRVIRLDSFSKILAPNIRCGWVTAPSYILDKLQILNEGTILQPSGLSQGLVSKLLNETWGMDGWEEHLHYLRITYSIRRDMLVKMVNKHLTGLVEYTVPSAGMFLWMKIHLGAAVPNDDLNAMTELLDRMKQGGVMMAPSMPFNSSTKTKLPRGRSCTHYLRASFGLVDVDMFEPALERLAQAIILIQRNNAVPMAASKCTPTVGQKQRTVTSSLVH